MRAKFVLSEVGIGLRRNLTMTFAVMITVAISLSLLGVGLLANSQVRVMKDYWYDKIEVSIFLCGSLSETQSCANGVATQEQKIGIQMIYKHYLLLRKFFMNQRPKHLQDFKKDLKDLQLRKM